MRSPPATNHLASDATERLAADDAGIARAAELITRGRLVAFPTETVYGLGARADDAVAVRAIFAAKGRPAGNPLIVHVPTVSTARELASTWTDTAEALATAFWPGPLTLVVSRRVGGLQRVADETAAGGSTVAVRVPAHPVALALLRATLLPVAAPSANRSTTISPTRADHVLKTLSGRIDAVVDGGPTGFGIESAIVDVSRSPAVLLRRGALSLTELQAIAPLVDLGEAVVADGERAAAPGSYARHYAPNALVRIVPTQALTSEVTELRALGLRTGSLSWAAPHGSDDLARSMPDDPRSYAASLYAALHALEDAGCEAIVIAAPPDDVAWGAVRDRLSRASVRA